MTNNIVEVSLFSNTPILGVHEHLNFWFIIILNFFVLSINIHVIIVFPIVIFVPI